MLILRNIPFSTVVLLINKHFIHKSHHLLGGHVQKTSVLPRLSCYWVRFDPSFASHAEEASTVSTVRHMMTEVTLLRITCVNTDRSVEFISGSWIQDSLSPSK